MGTVSIDKATMGVCHKHTDHSVVTKLAWIEIPCVHYAVVDIDYACFDRFTDLELRKFYGLLTGADFVGYSRPHMVAACVAVANSIPDADVNPFEVDLQYRAIPPGEQFYKYQKGKHVALALLGKQPPPRVPKVAPLSLAQIQALQVGSGAPAAPAPSVAVPAPLPAPRSPAVAPPARPQGAPAPAQAPTAPKGGQRVAIWAAMDGVWEAAGKPTDAPTILKLRKQCMDNLEQQGIKRTSASSELGNWQKARCSS